MAPLEEHKLPERRALILALVVREHVRHAQPVSSGALVDGYDLGVSAATVRSELAALEEAGMLTHPHTSAGRLPTVAGYRYFVEHLMKGSDLKGEEQRTIRHQFHQAGWEPERWMRLSASVVAQRSGIAGLVAARRDRERGGERTAHRLYHAGLTQILFAPEFSDSERMRGVVELLEYGRGIEDFLDRLPGDGVHVVFGGEPPLEEVPELTLVLSRFGQADAPAGILGAVGPTRMAYERAVPTVGFVADLMTELMAG